LEIAASTFCQHMTFSRRRTEKEKKLKRFHHGSANQWL